MHFDLPLHIVLIKCDDIPGVVASWCPELDVISQGYGPHDAHLACMDACRMVVEWDLTLDRDIGGGRSLPKRITHPSRRRWVPPTDPDMFVEDHEQYYIDYTEKRCELNPVNGRQMIIVPHIAISDDEFMQDDRHRFGIMHDNLEVITDCGFLFMNGPYQRSRYDQIMVPARRLSVTARFNTVSTRNLYVPATASEEEIREKALKAFGGEAELIEVKDWSE